MVLSWTRAIDSPWGEQFLSFCRFLLKTYNCRWGTVGYTTNISDKSSIPFTIQPCEVAIPPSVLEIRMFFPVGTGCKSVFWNISWIIFVHSSFLWDQKEFLSFMTSLYCALGFIWLHSRHYPRQCFLLLPAKYEAQYTKSFFKIHQASKGSGYSLAISLNSLSI